MNSGDYTKEDERIIIRNLQEENKMLRAMLARKGINAPESAAFSALSRNNSLYEPDQGGRIQFPFITEQMIRGYYAYFHGRDDVYARRTKKGSYYPQCLNFGTDVCPKMKKDTKVVCRDCESCHWKPVDKKIILAHLLDENNTSHMGVYPLLKDNSCHFLVFDFDCHKQGSAADDYANPDEEWKDEVDALRCVLLKHQIPFLTERSQSGKGAHIWIFFATAVSATLARNFGTALLEKGYDEVSYKTFRYYDRMFPSQDYVDNNGLGNLIALPLHGASLQEGNSAFIDENWNAYENQWEILFHTRRITGDEMTSFIQECNETHSFGIQPAKRISPWLKDPVFHLDQVTNGTLHVVLADGVYIDALNLTPYMQNQIRQLALFSNPEYYRRKAMKQYYGYESSLIYLGKDIDGYIKLPIGLWEDIQNKCKQAGITVDYKDERSPGKPIHVTFTGTLQDDQPALLESLLSHENGILSAATGSGKTVLCTALIAKRKVNTLILVQKEDLVKQWHEALNKFLVIDEELPVHVTPKGKTVSNKSCIGTLRSNTGHLGNIIDIAMLGTLANKENLDEILSSYGMVIMDECHHAASETGQKVLSHVRSKYIYGVTATEQRSDNLEKINYMYLGHLRRKYTNKQHADKTGIIQIVYPRFTRLVNLTHENLTINQAYELTRTSEIRNDLILQDARQCLKEGRTPVILTKYKEHAKYLAQQLENDADHVFLVYGDNTPKKNDQIITEMKSVPENESLVLVATGSKIGEGFDYTRLDTLFLAVPVSFSGLLEQYAGRIVRKHPGKVNAIIYDYVDPHLPVFDNMYNKRLSTYKKLGFIIHNAGARVKQQADAIYNGENYISVFEQDLMEAQKEVIISSPKLTNNKVHRFLELMKNRQEAGLMITIFTSQADDENFEDPGITDGLIYDLNSNGIRVVAIPEFTEHFACIDHQLVWYGGMNLLGKSLYDDNLIRIKDSCVAAELGEIVNKYVASL